VSFVVSSYINNQIQTLSSPIWIETKLVNMLFSANYIQAKIL